MLGVTTDITLVSMNLEIIQQHTHNRFTALLAFVQNYPGQPAPER